jgi:hypothetical protein
LEVFLQKKLLPFNYCNFLKSTKAIAMLKTIFDTATREDMISRIGLLQENSRSQWGKMTAAQMAKHCRLFEELGLGNKKYKRNLLGRLFGKAVLKDMIKDDKPLKQNMPSLPGFKIVETGIDFASEKKRWTELVQSYGQFSGDGFVHPFFGFLNKDQMGIFVYKHADHHLRQFAV